MLSFPMTESDGDMLRGLQRRLSDVNSNPEVIMTVPVAYVRRVIDILRPEWYEEQANAAKERFARTVQIEVPADATHDAISIMTVLLPEWASLFLTKNAKYRKVRSLGAKGVFPDVNRKVGALEGAVWEGEAPADESTREIIFDLIGHLFLMLRYLDAEEADRAVDGEAAFMSEADEAAISFSDTPALDFSIGMEHAAWEALPQEIKTAIRRMTRTSSLTVADMINAENFLKRVGEDVL